MKRRLAWVLVALVLASAVVIMLRPGKPKEREKLELSFLYYTNGPTSPEAVFAVHYPTGYTGGKWSPAESEYWESGKWNPWKPAGLGIGGMQIQGRGPLGKVAANGKRIDLRARFFIPNTNGSWRFRVYVNETPPIPFVERVKLFWGTIRQANHYSTRVLWGRRYWITNEVGPATKAQ
jgi:hypothetical protein